MSRRATGSHRLERAPIPRCRSPSPRWCAPPDLERRGAVLEALVLAYREAYLACCWAPGRGELRSGDEVRDHLSRSVLPRLATEGWIADAAERGWDRSARRWPGGRRRGRLGRASTSRAARARRAGRRGRPRRGRAPSAGRACSRACELCKSFKGRRVVDQVTIRVEQGEIVGLLGPNGAGKTTTFYLITGLIRPDDGRVLLDGRRPHPGADVPAGPGRDRLPGPGAVGLPQDDGRGEYSGDPRDAAAPPRRAAPPARADARRALDQAPAEEQGVLAERRRAAAARDHPGARDASRSSCCWTSRSPASTRSPCTTSRPSSPGCGTAASAC